MIKLIKIEGEITKKNKGFTLIELLAVIVILSIIALISTPIITGIIKNVRKDAYETSLREIFNATELFIATNEFNDFPEEGIDVIDTRIEMKNKDFTSGKIIKNDEGNLELDKVSNGFFCGGGTFNNLVIIEGSCDLLDTTPPTITIAYNSVTNNSITIVANGEDLESGINGYQFSSDSGNDWTSKQTSNIYTFTNLTDSTEYTFKVKVFNNNGLSTTSDSLKVTTSANLDPIYSVDVTGWSQSKVVTITYPEREVDYVYEYSLDSGATWTEVLSPNTTTDLIFNSNSTIIARITDGGSEISSSTYNVTNIDTENPTITFSMNGNDVYAKDRGTIVNAIDTDSGVLEPSLKYIWNTSATPPAEGDFVDTFTNSGIINTPSGLTGDYYLWILAKDGANNTTIVKSNVFKLDNTKPVITLLGNNPFTVTKGATYNEPGATANDNADGNITPSIDITGTVNTNVLGSYTITYNVTDSSGNIANLVARTVDVTMPINIITSTREYYEDPKWWSMRVYRVNNDGTVTMYQNSYGIDGKVDGYKSMGLTGITSAAAQTKTVYGVKQDGTIVRQTCDYAETVCTGPVSAMSGFQDIVAAAASIEKYLGIYGWSATRLYGLKSDGTVRMYQNSYGLDNPVDGFRDLPLTGITSIAAHESTLYATKTDGTIISYTCDYEDTTCPSSGNTISGFQDTVSVTVSVEEYSGIYGWRATRIYGLKSDGTVRMYQNSYGLDNPVDGFRDLPLTGVTSIAAEKYVLYATKTDGTTVSYTCDYEDATCPSSGSVMSGFNQ